MESSHLCCWICATIASLWLEMRSESLLSTLDGGLTVLLSTISTYTIDKLYSCECTCHCFICFLMCVYRFCLDIVGDEGVKWRLRTFRGLPPWPHLLQQRRRLQEMVQPAVVCGGCSVGPVWSPRLEEGIRECKMTGVPFEVPKAWFLEAQDVGNFL